VVDGVVYAGSAFLVGVPGDVFAVDGGTGEELWRFSVESSSSSPVVVDKVVYVGSSDGYLYAITGE
jgi:outer membrane protein assembly factor BamB